VCVSVRAHSLPRRAQATRTGAVEQRVLEALAARRCPRLVAALAAADAPLAALAAPWFPALFAGALPVETVARVWDCLMVEGPKVLFRVALALATVRLGRRVSVASQAAPLSLWWLPPGARDSVGKAVRRVCVWQQQQGSGMRVCETA